jgi:hypothetical protein
MEYNDKAWPTSLDEVLACLKALRAHPVRDVGIRGMIRVDQDVRV